MRAIIEWWAILGYVCGVFALTGMAMGYAEGALVYFAIAVASLPAMWWDCYRNKR